MQANAAAAVTLTTPPEEVSAAATVLQLEPFLSSTLLAAVKEGPAQGEAAMHVCPQQAGWPTLHATVLINTPARCLFQCSARSL